MKTGEPQHTFSGGDLDRAAHLREERAAGLLASEDSLFLPYRSLEVLVRGAEHQALAWLPSEQARPLVNAGADVAFLGLVDGVGRFAIDVPVAHGNPMDDSPTACYQGLRMVAPQLSAAEASTAALGRSLLAWHDAHRFCARCGSVALPEHGGHQRRCTSPECDAVQFPRTDPVVIMLIHRDDRCLVGRAVRSRRYPPGLYSCLAGYVEPGESIEEAVRREVLEESGIRIGRVWYHSSQPWPFPSQLMIGCFAEALSEELHIDPAELEEARWMSGAELQAAVDAWMDPEAVRLPAPLTIAHQLARAWLESRKP